MRSTNIIWIIGLVCCLLGCHSHTPHPTLVRVDSLTYVQPDSALLLLEEFLPQLKEVSPTNSTYYQLLTIRANFKAGYGYQDDSTALTVLSFYQKHPKLPQLAEAYYHAGKVYYNLGDTPRSMDCFSKSYRLAIEQSNNRLLADLHTHLGLIFHSQNLFVDALDLYKDAYHYSTLANDSLMMAYSARDLGKGYAATNSPDSALLYYNLSLEYAEKLSDSYLSHIAGREAAEVYRRTGNYAKACQLLKKSTPYSLSDITDYYISLAQYYYALQRNDSAQHFYLLVSHFGTYSQKQEAYGRLLNIAKQQNNQEKIFRYLEQYQLYSDSVRQKSENESQQRVNAFYHYQEREKETLRLQQKEQQKITFISISLTIAIIIALFLLYIFRKKQNEVARIHATLERICSKEYLRCEQHITENERKLIQIRRQMEESDIQLAQMLTHQQEQQTKIENLKVLLANERRTIQRLTQERLGTRQIYKDIYHIAGVAGYKYASNKTSLSDDDWEELYLMLNEVCDNFVDRLYCYCGKLGEQELRICCLYRIGLSQKLVCIVTNRSKQAVSSTNAKLSLLLETMEKKTGNWEIFMRDF